MDLSPEEYGAYWGGSLRGAAGVLLIVFGYRFVTPLLEHSEVGATGLGIVLFGGLVVAGCYLITLGLARVIRVAVDAEMRG